MAVLGDPLFHSSRGAGDLDDLLRAQKEALRREVDRIPEAELKALDDQAANERVERLARVTPLELQLGAATTNVEETNVEVTDRFTYDLEPGETLRLPGYRVTRTIPFTGDASLWRLKTNPCNLNSARGVVQGAKLTIGIELPVAESEKAKAYLANAINDINENLKHHQAQVERHNTALPALITPHIKTRRERLSGAADLLKRLQE